MKPSTIYAIARKSISAWVDDYAPSMGAAISYYTAFSIAPLLVIVIAIAGYVFGDEAVRGSLQGQISGLVGADGAQAIQGLISSAREPTEGVVATGLSIALLVVGATTVFAEIQSALDRIWHVPEKAKPSGLWGLLRARFLSFGLILGLAFLLMASLTVSAAMAAIGTYFSSLLPGWDIVLFVLNTAISLAVETVLFAMIFKFMPSTKIAWSDVWVGAVVTGVLFELGKVLIGLYVGKAGISSTYAAAGSIAVILIWVYYAAQIFLLGAEFTKVYATEYGSHRLKPTVASENPSRQGGAAMAGELAETGADGKQASGSGRLTSMLPAATTARHADFPPPGQVAVGAALVVGQWLFKRWMEKRLRQVPPQTPTWPRR
ncbi:MULTISPECIES: YihY/virulence factor BrkB family protein [unclassified Acidovorax]|uniref:YihY/virulence factor BrkB family protein n=1 Tax=unclassified Acidovorax TaxID=2684926 RepID=UPI0028830260|nr:MULTISPECIES: YihY/virulence factor BrkB family protein [unclassified Acidovorax]